jgi:hypothetical protein
MMSIAQSFPLMDSCHDGNVYVWDVYAILKEELLNLTRRPAQKLAH